MWGNLVEMKYFKMVKLTQYKILLLGKSLKEHYFISSSSSQAFSITPL